MNRTLIILAALGATGAVIYLATRPATATAAKPATGAKTTTTAASGLGGLIGGLKNLFGGGSGTSTSGTNTNGSTAFDPTNPGDGFTNSFDTTTSDNSGEDDNLGEFDDNYAVA